MKIYKISSTGGETSVVNGEHLGYFYASSISKARQYIRSSPKEYDYEITQIVVTPTKQGIISALNQYAEHPDNG